MNKELQKIISDLEDRLSNKRFRHSVGVMYTAASLAMRYGIDINKACTAGILHDYAKELSDEKLMDICKKDDVIITDYEKEKPYLLHGKAAACLVKNKYDIDDEEVLSAIAHHTVGKVRMTPLEAIIFIADYIEPNRKMIPGLTEIRRESFNDYNKACCMILENVIKYINEIADDEIDEDSRITFEYYKRYL